MLCARPTRDFKIVQETEGHEASVMTSVTPSLAFIECTHVWRRLWGRNVAASVRVMSKRRKFVIM